MRFSISLSLILPTSLVFFFFPGLVHVWQHALNLEQYETAQQLRNKLTEVSPLYPAYM
jgi:hypothetical protein